MDSVVSGMKKVMWTNEISGVTFGEVKLRLEHLAVRHDQSPVFTTTITVKHVSKVLK